MSVNAGTTLVGKGQDSLAILSWKRFFSVTSCACAEAVLHGLAGCCPVLGDSGGILSDKGHLYLYSGGGGFGHLRSEVIDTSPSTMGVNRAYVVFDRRTEAIGILCHLSYGCRGGRTP